MSMKSSHSSDIDSIVFDKVTNLDNNKPDFTPDDPEMWFTIMEMDFDTMNLTSDYGKCHCILAALDVKYTAMVKDVMKDKSINYEVLKNRLLKIMKKEILEKEVIGSNKPSFFLSYLKSKAGHYYSKEKLKYIWLKKLPEYTQKILSLQEDLDVDKMAELADVIQTGTTAILSDSTELKREVQKIKTSYLEHDKILMRMQFEIDMLKNSIVEMSSGGMEVETVSAQSSPNMKTETIDIPREEKTGLCWYHGVYGDKANNCVQPCRFKRWENVTEASDALDVLGLHWPELTYPPSPPKFKWESDTDE